MSVHFLQLDALLAPVCTSCVYGFSFLLYSAVL